MNRKKKKKKARLFREFNCNNENSVNFDKTACKCTFEILKRKKFLILRCKVAFFCLKFTIFI